MRGLKKRRHLFLKTLQQFLLSLALLVLATLEQAAVAVTAADAEGDVVANLYHVTSNDHPDSWSLIRG